MFKARYARLCRIYNRRSLAGVTTRGPCEILYFDCESRYARRAARVPRTPREKVICSGEAPDFAISNEATAFNANKREGFGKINIFDGNSDGFIR